MTYHVLECTDCLTVLKIRDLTNPVPLHCPRCGEGLDVKQARTPVPNSGAASGKAGTKPGAVSTGVAEPSAAARPTRYTGRGPQQSNAGVVVSLMIVAGVTLFAGAGLYATIRFFTSATANSIPQQSFVDTATSEISNRAKFPNALTPDAGNTQGRSAMVNPATRPPSAPWNAAPQSAPAAPEIASQQQSRDQNSLPGSVPQMPRSPGPPGFPGRPQFPGRGSSFPGRPTLPTPGSGIPGRFGQIPPGPGFPGNGSGDAGISVNRSETASTGVQGDLLVAGGLNAVGPQSTVEELLNVIRSGDGGPSISRALDLLSTREVEATKQAEVREILKPLINSPHVFVRKSAAEAYCQWASAKDIDELRKVLSNPDSLYLFAKKKAIATIGRLGDAELYPDLIRAVSDPPLLMDATTALSSQGAGVEQAILDAYQSVEGPLPKNMLLKVLQDVGTDKSLPFLEKLAASPDFTVRGSAEQALQAIRARQ